MSESVIRMARRAAIDPRFLAFALHQYAENQQMDEPALMDALGATPETLAHARLCRTPRTGRDSRQEDVDHIAARFGLNVSVLMQAVRDGEAVAVVENATPSALPESVTPIMAARDRQIEPPEGHDLSGACE